MLHPVIVSSIADAWLPFPAVNQCSSPTPNHFRILMRWQDILGSHHLHPDMELLGWFANCQMERQKWSYFKKWCICQDCSISSYCLRSWTRMSKWNRWITTVSTYTTAISKLSATAPQVNGLFVLNRAQESTEYTNIDASFLLALNMTGYTSQHNVEKRMLRVRRLALISLKVWRSC